MYFNYGFVSMTYKYKNIKRRRYLKINKEKKSGMKTIYVFNYPVLSLLSSSSICEQKPNEKKNYTFFEYNL